MEDGMPGSVAEEGGVERDNETPGKDVPMKVETNGDLTHEEQLEKGLSEADGIGVGGAHGLSSGSVGPSQIVAEMNGDSIQAEEVGTPQGSTPSESPPVDVVSGAGSSPTPATTTKGYGLRKWRRIRRDLSRDGGTIADASRILKRGLSITDPPKMKGVDKQKNHYEDESSVASVESRNIQSPQNSTETAGALDTELELELLGAVGNFTVGIDSETSDDRSSRFSTAASGPRSKPEGLGYGKDKNRVRNLGGKGSGHAVQPRGQRGKGSAVDVTKMLREDQLSFEKENSHSSIESDLRSSATVFAQWAGTTSNGRQSEGSLNYDGENGGEAQVSEEVQEGFHNGTGGDIEDTPRKGLHADIQVEDKTEESENYPPDQGGDPFAESIMLLREAQEALEKEIEKFREIGVEPTLLSGNSSVQFHYGETEGSRSVPLELKVMKLCQKVEHLEHELRETTTSLKAKEMRVTELEAILGRSKSPNHIGDTDIPQNLVKEMELELECLFTKKIEAEVKYLLISNASPEKRTTLEDPFSFVEQQESLAEGYKEAKVKMNVAEEKAILLKRKMEELDVSCHVLLETEEILKLQNGVSKFSLCCFVQVMLLFFAFALFLMQLLPPSADILPT